MPARDPKPFSLALFWLGIQTVWGALLGISLQARSLQLAGGDAMIAYGHLATIGASVAAVVQIAIGFWTDVRRSGGSRRIEFYVTGTIGGAIALAAFYQAGTFETLTLAYVALQATINVAIGPYQAIIPDFVEPRKTGVASSWMAAMQSIGNAIGAVLASVVADARILAGAIDALLLGSMAVTCAHLRTLELRPAPARRGRYVTRAFVDLFISRALVYVGFFTLVGYLLFYVAGVLGASGLAAARLQSGILILVFTVVGAIGAALAARPSDRMDKRLVAFAGGAGMIAALALFIASHSLGWAAAATCVAGLGWGVFLVADWALACRIMPPGDAATTMGLWNLALVIPQIVAPAFTTFVLQHFGLAGPEGGPRWAFALAIGEIAVGIAWLWRLSRCAEGE